MPRLNVYLSDEVYELADRWRGSSNLSEICARAIKDELEAAEGHRSISGLLETLRPPTDLENSLKDKYELAEALTANASTDKVALRESVGKLAAQYLDRNLTDGSLLALAGGRQMWCVVRNLSPRRIRSSIYALGMHQADPLLLHAHPNTLATFAWLLYSPRSEAHLINAELATERWNERAPTQPHASYFAVASCSSFESGTDFSKLIGSAATDALIKNKVVGDFAYSFFNSTGEEVETPLTAPSFRFSAAKLKQFSARSDARIILAAAGEEKLTTMKIVLKAGLCNTLVTDTETGRRLLQ